MRRRVTVAAIAAMAGCRAAYSISDEPVDAGRPDEPSILSDDSGSGDQHSLPIAEASDANDANDGGEAGDGSALEASTDSGADASADARPDAPACRGAACGPLLLADLTALDVRAAPGFATAGFRCKSLTVCPAAGGCFYAGSGIFGSVQSSEDTFSDGQTLATSVAARLLIDYGAASQCGDPPITIQASESVTMSLAGRAQPVYLPAFSGRRLELFLAADGSTYYDAALTSVARLRP